MLDTKQFEQCCYMIPGTDYVNTSIIQGVSRLREIPVLVGPLEPHSRLGNQIFVVKVKKWPQNGSAVSSSNGLARA